MESEVTLYEQITAFKAVAAFYDTLYPPLLAAHVPSTLLQLAAQHENTEVAAAIWAVWAEWIDPSLLLLQSNDDDIET